MKDKGLYIEQIIGLSSPLILSALKDLLNTLIEECHLQIENAEGNEFVRIQGKIMAYKYLKISLNLEE